MFQAVTREMTSDVLTGEEWKELDEALFGQNPIRAFMLIRERSRLNWNQASDLMYDRYRKLRRSPGKI